MRFKSIYTEASPLAKQESLVVFRRDKTAFNFPVHKHIVYEIDYIINAAGARRIIGDNMAEITDHDLVLIADINLEHGWLNYKNKGIIHEIIIQFSPDFFTSGIFEDRLFVPLKKLLNDAARGVSFSQETILENMDLCEELANTKDGVKRILLFIKLMTRLAESTNQVILSSRLNDEEDSLDSWRKKTGLQYLQRHFSDKVSLEQTAEQVHMTPASFSHYLKRCTGMNFMDTLNGIRISEASRLLLEEEDETIAGIAIRCGFNNISNFNRIFKKLKGMTPNEYRHTYISEAFNDTIWDSTILKSETSKDI